MKWILPVDQKFFVHFFVQNAKAISESISVAFTPGQLSIKQRWFRKTNARKSPFASCTLLTKSIRQATIPDKYVICNIWNEYSMIDNKKENVCVASREFDPVFYLFLVLLIQFCILSSAYVYSTYISKY